MRKNGKPQTFSNLAVGMVQFLFLTAPVTAQIPCSYDVQIIASPLDCGLGTVNTFGLGLNENGAVVGYYKCPLWENFQGFMWTAEAGFEALDPPQGVVEVFPRDINNNGIICGTLRVSGVGNRGFVYDDGVWTILPPVVDVPGAWSSAAAINNAETVVGQRSITEGLNPQNAYIWSAEKGFTDLGVMNGANSAATAVSASSLVTGWIGNGTTVSDGFLWEDGSVELLGPVPGGFTTTPNAVAMSGAIVGSGLIRLKGAPIGASRAFLWENREFRMLVTLPDHTRSRANDITSDRRQVVGRSWNVDDNPNIAHGFIWSDGIMTNLNDLVSPDLEIVIRSAAAIANASHILANGDDPTPTAVAFLLAPVEEPVGDLNEDCHVGVIDLLILFGSWGDPKSPADLNSDGIVDHLDLMILLDNWG